MPPSLYIPHRLNGNIGLGGKRHCFEMLGSPLCHQRSSAAAQRYNKQLVRTGELLLQLSEKPSQLPLQLHKRRPPHCVEASVKRPLHSAGGLYIFLLKPRGKSK